MKFSIGEMAKLHNISAQTLRYYDKINLLKPKIIDENNKYRYYTIDQFEKLHTIKYLKFLGMSLIDIKNHLEKRDINNILSMLENQKDAVETKIKEYNYIKEKIDNKIKTIRNYINVKNHDKIEIKEISERKIASINTNDKTIPDGEFDLYLNQLQNLHKENSWFISYDIGVIISSDNLKKHIFDRFKAIFFLIDDNELPSNKHINILPKAKYACAYHKGLFSETYKSYNKLLKYLNNNNYSIIGDSIEIGLIDTTVIANEEELFLEIQIPIK